MDGKLRNMTSLYLTDESGILCLYRLGSRVAHQRYVGAAGGHFEQDEGNNARKCVLREMKEELGLAEGDVADLRLRYITYRLKDGEIRQNYYFFGRLKEPRELRSNEGVLTWVTYEEAADLHMPVSAKHMLQHYLYQGRFDDHLYAGITQETGTDFVILREFEG